jgi:membrane protein implicated in regulation of membrane protease activity
MFEIPVEDFVFIVCLIVGGGLLLITVLVDDILGGLLDFLNIGFDIGGVSLMPLLLAFVSMFGVGGLFATRTLDVHGAAAAGVGVGFGAVGFVIAYVLFNILRRAEGAKPFSTSDLVGRDALVAVGIPAGRFGSIHVKAEGQTHEFSATASVDVAAGTIVRITGAAGTALIVAPLTPTAPRGESASQAADAAAEGEIDRG